MKGVARISTGALVGFNGQCVDVEADTTKGLPSLQIVGLASKAVDEAKERVRSAIRHSLLEFPASRVTISLSPAELPKNGSHFDLAIALAILVSSGQLTQAEVDTAFFAGELTLDGKVRPIRGTIALAELAQESGAQSLFIPVGNLEQALLVSNIPVYGISSLKELFLHLKGEVPLEAATRSPRVRPATHHTHHPLLDSIYGQEQAKRAITIAAAGHHNLLLNGPPGAGKTMLAKTLAGILPPLTDHEILTVTKLHNLITSETDSLFTERPFRTPHHTASRVALIGGGNKPQPGEVSLAHLGVLMLDEMPEYPRSTLESLRQPLEDKHITVSRATGNVTYPADFLLIGTMNPCPCGYYGDDTRECLCTPQQISSYHKRISGPLLDRIDMTLTTKKISNRKLLEYNSSSKIQHETAQASIAKARETQRNRYKSSLIYNGNVSIDALKKLSPIDPAVPPILEKASEKLGLSARSYFKILRLARTIADLEQSPSVQKSHAYEALQYRQVNPTY